MTKRRQRLMAFGLELKASARRQGAGLAAMQGVASRFAALGRFDGPEAFHLLVEWTRARFAFAGVKNAVLGVSGGVDSSLVACILSEALPRTTRAYVLPCGSNPRDEADARALCDCLGLPVTRIDLAPAFTALKAVTSSGARGPATADGNLKTRLRTATLFHEAAVHRALLVGTGDMDEGFIGYYTKGSASDVSIIGGLHKGEVRRMLKGALGRFDARLARRLAARPADAGLSSRTAEEDLGVTYDEIGRALEVVSATCNVVETGLYPREVEHFAEALEASGVSEASFRRIAAHVAANRHKALGLSAPFRRPPPPVPGEVFEGW